MKRIISICTLLVCLFIGGKAQTNTFPATGSAGIGTIAPNASSLLEIKSTTKGILIPRMTLAQRNAITSPAQGLMIFQTNNTMGFYYYNGTNWVAVSAKGANLTLSNLSATSINQNLISNANGTLDLGSDAFRWDTAFINKLRFSDGSTQSATGWGLNGNTGTNAAANFLGTTDAQPFVMRVNNQRAGYIDYATQSNTSFGYQALSNNTNGYNNVAIGYQSLYTNTSGTENFAMGTKALYYNTTGYNNVATGNSALFKNNIGEYNTANGTGALYFNTSGSENTALGYFSLGNTTGIGNTAVGTYALQASTTGSYNTSVGYNAGILPFSFANYDNNTTLGYGAYGTANNQVRIGNGDITSIGGYTNWSNISDGRFKKNIKENVKGLAFINKLKPVTYNLDITGINNKLLPGGLKDKDGKAITLTAKQKEATSAKEKIIYSGFVAQDVEKSAKELGYDFSGVDAPKNDLDLYGLRYAEFVVPLVKAVQELSAMNDVKDEKINSLQKQIDELKILVDKIAVSPQIADRLSTVSIAASLEQNVPNPFSRSSIIRYTLPDNYSEAYIVIINAEGKTVKRLNISGAGKGSVTVEAGLLQAGVYKYALYIDKRIVESRTMMMSR